MQDLLKKFGILDPRDNALFLQNWRERTRQSSVISSIVLATIIIVLIFLYSYFNVNYITYRNTSNNPTEWLRVAFFSIACFQGVILIILGTMSVDRMTVRERASGTIEYHRSSPTSRINQYLGILLGAPSLEWCVFFGTLVISFLLALGANINLVKVLAFYLQLMLATVFYHSIAILLALCANQRTLLTHRRFSAVHLVIAMLFMSGAFMFSQSSGLYHLTWYPGYEQLTMHIFPDHLDRFNAREQIMYSFFGISLPSIVLQIMVQLPLLIFLVSGIMRQISQPDYPIFSKPHSALAIFFLLFLFIGSSDSYLKYSNLEGFSYQDPLDIVTPMFLVFLTALGIIGALSITPSRLLYQKGLRRIKKLNQSKMQFSDDHNSNVFWLMAVCFLITVTFGVFSLALSTPIVNHVLALLIILFRIIFFASAFEYFQLCRHHRKASLFWTGISILWFFLPLVSTIISKERMTPVIFYLFQSFSPFWGIGSLLGLLIGRGWDFDPASLNVTIDFICSFVAAVFSAVMAAEERAKCQKEILK